MTGNVTFTGPASVTSFAEQGAEKTEKMEPTIQPFACTTEIKLTVGVQDCGSITYTYRP